jgi:formate hydrogenlyase subunit 7
MLKQLLQGFTRSASTYALQDHYPKTQTLDEGLFGVPRLRFELCSSCGACAEACPTNAISLRPLQDPAAPKESQPIAQKLSLQLGSCVFCGRCKTACGNNAIQEDMDVEIAVSQRDNLLQVGVFPSSEDTTNQREGASLDLMIERVNLSIFGVFSRSLQLYVASAGSCGGCEEELTAALGPFYQGTRLGVSITANPLQADAIFVTGPVPRALVETLQRAYHRAPSPKIACACDGNVFQGSYAVLGAADKALPVDVYIPGCPPTPKNLLHGLLLGMERVQEKLTRAEYLAPGLPQSLLTSLRQRPATTPMPNKHSEREKSPAPKTEAKEEPPAPPNDQTEVALPSASPTGELRISHPVEPDEPS